MQVLASPTDNMGTLLSAIHRVKIGGTMRLANAIQVAQLALKHRRNKTGERGRVDVCFKVETIF